MYRQKPEDVIGAARPFTGAQYLESLRDGREVWEDEPPGLHEGSSQRDTIPPVSPL